MSPTRAFVGLGSSAPDARPRLEQALAGLEREGLRVAAVAPPVRGPFLGPSGEPVPGAPAVLNTVAEIASTLAPAALLGRLLRLEQEAGRVRDGGPLRTLDLDLLALGDHVEPSGPPALPHPRALARAFVLLPWREIAPTYEPAGTGASVLVHAARLEARLPRAVGALTPEPALTLPSAGARPVVLHDRAALCAWREALPGGGAGLSLVPTMGALHEGHATLVRRARAASGPVLATVFVNPLQFGPAEDLGRYPRTFERDLEVLAGAGADAVYAPQVHDLYPPGFATAVEPGGPALGFEGALRPGHFRGVATVVLKLLQRSGAARAWFGQKDAQQVAVVQRLVADLDLPVALEVAPIVRDADGLALSSRNRYLSADERARARALPAALQALALEAARGERDAAALCARARGALTAAGLVPDYVALVEPGTFTPLERLGQAPALALATVRAGATRLLDNRWVVALPPA